MAFFSSVAFTASLIFTGGTTGTMPLINPGTDSISSSTLNSLRFAYNRTDISRTSTDFFSAPEVGINIFSYMPHYMLLTVTNGFQLGGGTESESTFTTPAWQISDDLTLLPLRDSLLVDPVALSEGFMGLVIVRVVPHSATRAH